MSDVVLVDGVSVESDLRFLEFEGFGNLFTTPVLAGNNYAVPKRDGEQWRQKSFAANEFPLRFAVVSGQMTRREAIAELHAEWNRLLRMFPRRRTVTVTRVVPILTEYGVRESRQTATCELVDAVTPQWLSHRVQKGVVTLRNLEGVWYSEDETVFNVNAGVTEFLPAKGTTDTGNIEVTLTGGVGVQTLTNVSAGVWLSYNWSGLDPTSRVVINVPNFTSRRYYGTVSAVSLSRLGHGGDERFMVVDPDHGDNEFTVSSGTAQITYREAYL